MDFKQLKPLALLVASLALASCASAPKSSIYTDRSSAELATMVGDAAQGDVVQLPEGNSLGLSSVMIGRTYFAASGRECRRLNQVDGTPLLRVACKGSDGVWRFARDLQASASFKDTSTTFSGSILPQTLVTDSISTTLSSEDEAVVMQAAQSEVEEYNPNQLPNWELSEGASAIDQNSVQLDVESLMSEPGYGDSIPFDVNQNETLWSFAKRTTGNALNWQAIAEHNGISNAKRLASGSVLNVPAELVRVGE